MIQKLLKWDIQFNLKRYVKRYGIYVKEYGFLSFAKNTGTHGRKVGKNLSNKYSQKLLDTAKIYTKDAIQTASKRTI